MNDVIYAFQDYVRETIVFPHKFDPHLKVIVGGELPNDPLEVVLMKDQGGPGSGQQDLTAYRMQFLIRAQNHGRARDLTYAIYDADSLGSKLPDGRSYHERGDFYIKHGSDRIRVAYLKWLQSPIDLGAVQQGYVFSMNTVLQIAND